MFLAAPFDETIPLVRSAPWEDPSGCDDASTGIAEPVMRPSARRRRREWDFAVVQSLANFSYNEENSLQVIFMKIYTRTGDQGSTGLFGGPCVSKDDARIEAYGTVDELNAALGIARSAGLSQTIDDQLAQIQAELFSLGAELATPDPVAHPMLRLSQAEVERLESWIDVHEESLSPLKNFVLPAGSLASTQLHLARAICRRAERRVITLARIGVESGSSISPEIVVYLNRLSDLLFVLTRVANRDAGVGDVLWVQEE